MDLKFLISYWTAAKVLMHVLPLHAGDTADVAPEFFDGNKDVAGVASGVSARPDRNHKRADGPSSWDPPKGSPSAPDFEKRLSRDPHEADIPDFPGLNPKNQVRWTCCAVHFMPPAWHRIWC